MRQRVSHKLGVRARWPVVDSGGKRDAPSGGDVNQCFTHGVCEALWIVWQRHVGCHFLQELFKALQSFAS